MEGFRINAPIMVILFPASHDWLGFFISSNQYVDIFAINISMLNLTTY